MKEIDKAMPSQSLHCSGNDRGKTNHSPGMLRGQVPGRKLKQEGELVGVWVGVGQLQSEIRWAGRAPLSEDASTNVGGR